MKLRVVLIIVAVIIAGVAVFAVMMYISNIRKTADQEVEKIEVLVAAENIQKETFVDILIGSEKIALEPIPRKYLAEGVLTSLDNYKGYVTVAPISKGEQITSTRFAKPEQIGLAFNIPKDMVAISIPVDEVIGVSNLINIGDMVNVIATFKPQEQEEEEEEAAGTPASVETTAETETTTVSIPPEESEEFPGEVKEPITKTLLWNVEVLYVGTRVTVMVTEEERGAVANVTFTESKREETTMEVETVTLAVSPEDSEKLVFTEEMGYVWLALAPADGVEEKETPGRTYKNIFEKEEYLLNNE
jgi:Flp pilus assembly protein CpaB